MAVRHCAVENGPLLEYIYRMWFVIICLGILVIFFIVSSKKDKEINSLKKENYKLKRP